MASTLPQYPLQGFCLDLQQWQQINISIIRNKTACKLQSTDPTKYIKISVPLGPGPTYLENDISEDTSHQLLLMWV